MTETRLQDGTGQSAGNIDIILIAFDDHGRVTDFGAVEVQAVYISGNVRAPFEQYMSSRAADFSWPRSQSPRPDYLSSSRKRLAPQLLFKGGIFHAWGKKTAIVLRKSFFETLQWNASTNRYQLERHQVIYTRFDSTLSRITVPRVGDADNFIYKLQKKLDISLGSA